MIKLCSNSKSTFFSFQLRIKHSLSILILMLPTLMWNYQTMRYRVFNWPTNANHLSDRFTSNFQAKLNWKNLMKLCVIQFADKVLFRNFDIVKLRFLLNNKVTLNWWFRQNSIDRQALIVSAWKCIIQCILFYMNFAQKLIKKLRLHKNKLSHLLFSVRLSSKAIVTVQYHVLK